MKNLILILLLFAITLQSQPKLEDFVLEGYEDHNFTNVLLNPNAEITNFYLVTDNGKVLDVDRVATDQNVKEVYTVDGKISEAITYDSIHYLSVNLESEALLIATSDFINIDTLYNETNAEITDFQIDSGMIYTLSNNGETGKVSYKDIEIAQWQQKDIPNIEYNRLFVMDSLLLLFKYINQDLNIQYVFNLDSNWKTQRLLKDYQKYISDFKSINNKIAVLGTVDNNLGNRIAFLENNFDYFWQTFGAVGYNVTLDTGFEYNFEIKNNESFFQVGYLMNECECAYIYKFTFQGDAYQNRYTFENSSSLNKIKSNARSNNEEFVAVGNDGLIVLINRKTTSSELQTQPSKENPIAIYPNPLASEQLLQISSKNIINKIELYDITGRQLSQWHNINSYQTELNLSNFTRGMYILKVDDKANKVFLE